MTTVRNPKTMKSYHSSAFPTTTTATWIGLGVELLMGISIPLTATLAVLALNAPTNSFLGMLARRRRCRCPHPWGLRHIDAGHLQLSRLHVSERSRKRDHWRSVQERRGRRKSEDQPKHSAIQRICARSAGNRRTFQRATEPRRWQPYLPVVAIRHAPLPASFPVARLGYAPRHVSGAVCVWQHLQA